MGENYPTFTGDLPKYIGEVIKTEMKAQDYKSVMDLANAEFDGEKLYELMGYSSQHSAMTAIKHFRNGRPGNVNREAEVFAVVLFALKIEEDHELVKLYREHCKKHDKNFVYPLEESLSYTVSGNIFRQKGFKKRKESKIEKLIDKNSKPKKK